MIYCRMSECQHAQKTIGLVTLDRDKSQFSNNSLKCTKYRPREGTTNELAEDSN